MKVVAYLAFNGQCAEAFKFYQQVLGGDIVAMIPYSEAPHAGDMPEESRGRIMHARLITGEGTLMGGDAPSEAMASKPGGFCLSVHPATVEDGERVFNALGEGGSVTMPYGATFWALGFGMLTDKFGIPWMVNVEKDIWQP